MHNPALQACGIDAQYVRVQVPVGRVAESFQMLAKAGFWGVNVTIPHKFEALDAVDEVDPLARTLGAVNTVHIKDGRLIGYNSDGPGFLNAVKEAFDVSVRDLRVVVLGAGGGAGRAVAVQCFVAGCKSLALQNRTASKTTQLALDLESMRATHSSSTEVSDCQSSQSLLEQVVQADLIINGTSLGMKADDAPLLPAGVLSPRHMVFDMVYRAGGGNTQLGEAALASGARYADGVLLLLHQGAISFEHWFDRPAPLEAMRAGLAAALRS